MPKNSKLRIKTLVLVLFPISCLQIICPLRLGMMNLIYFYGGGKIGLFSFSLNLEIALLAVKSLLGFRVLANSACIYLRDKGWIRGTTGVWTRQPVLRGHPHVVDGCLSWMTSCSKI